VWLSREGKPRNMHSSLVRKYNVLFFKVQDNTEFDLDTIQRKI